MVTTPGGKTISKTGSRNFSRPKTPPSNSSIELVKRVIEYRASSLKPAQDKAKKFGYKGAMYPWEAAHTGNDVCPGQSYIELEIHVTGDIVHLLKQYIYATHDWEFFKNNDDVWKMLCEIAAFFESRVVFNETLSSYVINKVMGPDEWNSPVNNSVFTNVVARNALEFASEVAFELKQREKQALKWKEMAAKIYIPRQSYSKVGNYHPEFDGFEPEKTVVKQADAIMLGFPLMFDMSIEEQRNDLEIYAEATTQKGPAMTWGMFAINYLSVNEPQKAKEMYLKQLKNIHQPFLIWSEQADGSGATNFLTGIGAYLQSILYGYLGIRYLPDKMLVQPNALPFNARIGDSSIILNGIKYRGNSFTLTVDESYIEITLLKTPTIPSTCVSIYSNHDTYRLCKPNDKLHLIHAPFEISYS